MESLLLLATGVQFGWATAAKVTVYPIEAMEAPIVTNFLDNSKSEPVFEPEKSLQGKLG